MTAAQVTRRRLLSAGAAAGATWALGGSGRRLVEAAAAIDCPAGASLSDIEHVVILIQENRSFDHYFGTYRGVDGFARHPAHSYGAFAQPYPANKTSAPLGRLLPYRFDTQNSDGECTSDPDHSWGTQHLSWNHGRNDGFVTAHEQVDGAGYGPAVMGYYERADLPFHHALADAFTICDQYHCSVFGPTYPNRLYSMSATIDPDGKAGGPVVTNPTNPYSFSWETMPERMQDAGISWKVYSQADSNNNVLPFFKQYEDPSTPIAMNGLVPTWPADFQADVGGGSLPEVSWVLAPMDYDEHPSAPPEWGAWVQSQVLATLVSNPQVWERTVLFIVYDENGGFFDHVLPPVAPRGTPGEWVTVNPLPDAASGVAGPIGLGFRVPALVVSPFSRGGFVCSETFDHTSLLRFLETRFGVGVPNLSEWRRSVTGDLVGALNLVAAPRPDVPTLPSVSPSDPMIVRECGPTFAQGQGYETAGVPNMPPYPVPATQAMPRQEPGVPRRPSGRCDELLVSLTGVPRRAGRRSFRIKVRIVHNEPLESVVVRLNGHRVRHPGGDRFAVTIAPRGLRAGVNTVTVKVLDSTARSAAATARVLNPASRKAPVH
ncbi:MAG TPA: alkaline phosphatase family protein [Solirubrobacteraceae bacterium]|nr:alkaline phosphatase family protein [Solirubrobacteraceae bacterium]